MAEEFAHDHCGVRVPLPLLWVPARGIWEMKARLAACTLVCAACCLAMPLAGKLQFIPDDGYAGYRLQDGRINGGPTRSWSADSRGTSTMNQHNSHCSQVQLRWPDLHDSSCCISTDRKRTRVCCSSCKPLRWILLV